MEKPPSPLWGIWCPLALLTLCLLDSSGLALMLSLPRGRVGEPALLNRDGVEGPLNSAFCKGLGPLTIDERLLRDIGCGKAKEVRRLPGLEGYGDVVGEASEGKAGPAESNVLKVGLWGMGPDWYAG